MQIKQVSGRTIFILKEPPKLIFSGLKAAIGKNREYEKNLQDTTYFEKTEIEIDLTIPVNLSNEWKSIHKEDQNV